MVGTGGLNNTPLQMRWSASRDRRQKHECQWQREIAFQGGGQLQSIQNKVK